MTSQKHISISQYGVQITGVESHTEIVSIVPSHTYTTRKGREWEGGKREGREGGKGSEGEGEGYSIQQVHHQVS